MYAITATGFRAISAASDAQAGETVVESLPDTLQTAIVALNVRQRRDALLSACDWTQGNDSPLTSDAKAKWAAYRVALRNVPEQAGFPETVAWPELPTN
jgi:hypothetical protein